MTEEIIIDGVDVAECEFLRNCIIPDNYGCKIDDSLCCDVGNCYYKQLKRLEQKNKALKKQIESDKGLITVGGKQQYDMTIAYDKCKTALEEIKSIIINDDSILLDKKDNIEFRCGEPIAFKLQTIYNKINEVLDKG